MAKARNVSYCAYYFPTPPLNRKVTHTIAYHSEGHRSRIQHDEYRLGSPLRSQGNLRQPWNDPIESSQSSEDGLVEKGFANEGLAPLLKGLHWLSI